MDPDTLIKLPRNLVISWYGVGMINKYEFYAYEERRLKMKYETTDYAGIDYGFGKTNIDNETGIRFGVINQNEVLQAWADSSESEYGEPTCPKCGNKADDADELTEEMEEYEINGVEDYVCHDCKYIFDAEDMGEIEPIAFTYDEDGYKCIQSHDDTDIFIEKSPYYTFAQFCSPCAPGAGYLKNPLTIDNKSQVNPNDQWPNNKTYCFGHDWFENGEAPYSVYSVETGELVNP